MSSRIADRNLLFGINALQNDFITRDALIAAMNAWVLAKDRPIGEILVEQAALEPADLVALDAMMARRLAKQNALAKLPDEERSRFRGLWADVDRLLAKARAGTP